MMFDLLLAIENSALGVYIRESNWGFAIALSVHAVGMALSVGVMMIINFRILGALKQVPVLPQTDLFGTAWFGFIINLLSGLALYTSHATQYTYEWVFMLKLSLILVGGLLMKYTIDAIRANKPESTVKLLSFFSVTCWIGAVVTGRLMAYFYTS